MEFHRLRYFVTVAREGSFTRAAEQLYVTQPSLSEQIRKLEQELGTALFERLARRVMLTPAGHAFLPHATQALAAVESGKSQVREILGLKGGRVGIGALPSVGAYWLPQALAEFRTQAPHVEVLHREESLSAHLERQVELGELDLAIIRLPLSRPSLSHRVILRDPLMAVVPPGHRLASRRKISVSELRHEGFITMKPGNGSLEVLLAQCRRAGFEPRIVMETTQVEVVRGLVEAGMGVSILPKMAVPNQRHCVALKDPGAVRELAVIWRSNGYLSTAAKALLRILYAHGDREADGPDPQPNDL